MAKLTCVLEAVNDSGQPKKKCSTQMDYISLGCFEVIHAAHA